MEIKWYLVVAVFGLILGAVSLSIQMYTLVKLDAESRGMEKPKWWGALTLAGSNSSGLLMYLLLRKKDIIPDGKYKEQILACKKKAGVSLAFICVFVILTMIASIYQIGSGAEDIIKNSINSN